MNQLEVHRTLKHWSFESSILVGWWMTPVHNRWKSFSARMFQSLWYDFLQFWNILLFKANNTLVWMCSCQWAAIGRAEYQCRTWVNNSSVRGLNTNTNKPKTFSLFYFSISGNFTHPWVKILVCKQRSLLHGPKRIYIILNNLARSSLLKNQQHIKEESVLTQWARFGTSLSTWKALYPFSNGN